VTLPYPGEKIRPDDPDYWTWKYAFWSMRRHPGIVVLMLIWSSVMAMALGSLFSVPLVLLRRWIGENAVRVGSTIILLLAIPYGVFFGMQMCREPFWWVSRRGGSRFD
jgi:hypothetical protein